MSRIQERGWVGKGRRVVWRGGRRWLLGVVVAALAACGSEREKPVLVLRADPPTPAPQENRSSAEVSQPVATPSLEESQEPSSGSDQQDPLPLKRVSYQEAESVFRERRYQEAADLFELYARGNPTNPWGHYMLGISAWRAGDHERAEDALRKTLELDPRHAKSMMNLARVLLEDRRPSEALDPAGRVVDLHPDLGEGWRVLGNVHAELGRVGDAADAYRRAIALDPTDAWSMNNLGLLRIQQGDVQGALGPLARATELEPEVALFQNNFGIALERSGYVTDALAAFQAALEVEPDYAKALVSLERVQGLEPSSPLMSVELSELSFEFRDEVHLWQEELGREVREEDPSGVPGPDL